MTAFPLPLNDGGVAPLVECWGGEAAAFQDIDLRAHLAKIGRARVLELATPLVTARQDAAKEVLAAYAPRGHSVRPDHARPLHHHTPRPPAHLLAIHTEGEEAFVEIGAAYPATLPGSFGERLINGG